MRRGGLAENEKDIYTLIASLALKTGFGYREILGMTQTEIIKICKAITGLEG